MSDEPADAPPPAPAPEPPHPPAEPETTTSAPVPPESVPRAPTPAGPSFLARNPGILIGPAAVLVFFTGVWLAIDLDGDGLTAYQEAGAHTYPWWADSDGDTLADGWETSRQLGPRHPDSDLDGLHDGQEVAMRSNPLDLDTDDDGWRDAQEGPLVEDDCDNDGALAVADQDDDSDQRMDALELPILWCKADSDNDGILDGYERNLACATRTDCDDDGLPDATENGTQFDALDPDTFGVGLTDGILKAFQDQGQPAGGDTDRDGIPDGWETSAGLIEWGPFVPTADRRDLLVEFVRVQGPDSGKFTFDFASVYALVAAQFRDEANIRFQYVETVVTLDVETRPTLLPSSGSPYYRDLIGRARYSENPYVTTVVMNPQHDQSGVLHGGIAPIKGVLAAIDYGAYTTMRYSFNTTEITLSPFIESLIAADRDDVIPSYGFSDGGTTASGEYFLQGPNYRLFWKPLWFKTAPRAVLTNGQVRTSTLVSATLDTNALADVVLHELGHTLGLCHLDIPECLAGLDPSDQSRALDSTMHPSAALGTLHFLPSEWAHAAVYLTCPPQRPIQLIAEDADADDIIDAKYGYVLASLASINVRSCGNLQPLPDEYEPDLDLFEFRPEPQNATYAPVQNSVLGTVAYGLGAMGVAALAGFLVARRGRAATLG